jgi:hypothetical protein
MDSMLPRPAAAISVAERSPRFAPGRVVASGVAVQAAMNNGSSTINRRLPELDAECSVTMEYQTSTREIHFAIRFVIG